MINTPIIFTDGSGETGSNGKCGWGIVVLDSTGKCLMYKSGFSPSGSNNRGEIKGAIAAVKEAMHYDFPTFLLVTDSKYVLWGLTKQNTGPLYGVVNSDLWDELYSERLAYGRPFTVCWVKGHTKVPGNNLCDRLAKKAMRKQKELQWEA